MREIDVMDEAVFDSSPDEVFAALRDEATGKSQWWRPTVELHPHTDTPPAALGGLIDVVVPGRPSARFTERFEEIVPGQRIRMEYVAGDFVGEGLWSLEPLGGGEQTRVTFRWHVRPNSWGMWLATLFIDVRKRHHGVVRKGFEGLRQYIHAMAVSEPLLALPARPVRFPVSPPSLPS